eukprot:jgi/Botrbrau1/13400/Bobra.0082s0007.1
MWTARSCCPWGLTFGFPQWAMELSATDGDQPEANWTARSPVRDPRCILMYENGYHDGLLLSELSLANRRRAEKTKGQAKSLSPKTPPMPQPRFRQVGSRRLKPATISLMILASTVCSPVYLMVAGMTSETGASMNVAASPNAMEGMTDAADPSSSVRQIDTTEVPLEPSSEPGLDQPDAQSANADNDPFCSLETFTLEQAQSYARRREVRGAKPVGIIGAPYVPLAPWACQRGPPELQPAFQRLPGPVLNAPAANISGKVALSQYGIQFHGGPVVSRLRVYYVWYGNWAIGDKSRNDLTTVKILEDFAQSLGGSGLWATTATYTDSNGVPISTGLDFAGSVSVVPGSSCHKGSSGVDNLVGDIVRCLLNSGAVSDKSGTMYVVLPTAQNSINGFCTSYCGWHSWTGNYLTGLVPSAANCGNCGVRSSSPNNNGDADSMASILFHEFTECASDPFVNAWYRTSTGDENADLCAWKFGSTSRTPSPGGGDYNVRLTCPSSLPNCVSRYWLIQQNWINQAPSGYCGILQTQSSCVDQYGKSCPDANGICPNFNIDPKNCGGCGWVCPDGYPICIDGKTCGQQQTCIDQYGKSCPDSNGICPDFQNDPQYDVPPSATLHRLFTCCGSMQNAQLPLSASRLSRHHRRRSR